MSTLPIALNGERVAAVVVGGGEIGTRKALALIESGVTVTVIAPSISPKLGSLASPLLTIIEREYSGPADISDAEIVIAATSSEVVNAKIADDARALHRLVNVVSDGSAGSFTSMAIHRAGQLTIGVATGGVPAEAARIRDELSRSFNAEYAASLDRLASLRRQAKEAIR